VLIYGARRLFAGEWKPIEQTCAHHLDCLPFWRAAAMVYLRCSRQRRGLCSGGKLRLVFCSERAHREAK
jgi:hypothetical protein